jgi:hypothetical protein
MMAFLLSNSRLAVQRTLDLRIDPPVNPHFSAYAPKRGLTAEHALEHQNSFRVRHCNNWRQRMIEKGQAIFV